jgi:PAS domain S-box-containing protein
MKQGLDGGGRMNSKKFWQGSDGVWNSAIIISLAAVLYINLAGLMVGLRAVLPHLLYIPVVIAAYRYPRRGLLFASVVGVVYFIMAFSFAGGAMGLIVEALIRTGVIIVIGWLIAFLSARLRDQESLYRGLFDNSEAGSLLIHRGESEWIVEDANERAATLLERAQEDLEGKPLSLFWAGEEEEAIFFRLATERKVNAAETIFSPAEGGDLIVLVSLAPLPQDRAILTFVNITGRVNAEKALQTANDKLSLLSRIANDHLHRTVNEIIETVDDAAVVPETKPVGQTFEKIRRLAWGLARQLFLAESYQDLGASPPIWIPVQSVLAPLGGSGDTKVVSRRFWTERLEIYADRLFREVLTHLVDNSLRHGGNLKNIVVTYHETGDGLDLVIEDDGVGIPDEMKDRIFEYDSGKHAGLGLFICRQILSVTDMTIAENGLPGKGARFVINVPEGNYRIEGSYEDAPPFPVSIGAGTAGRGGVYHKSGAVVRELVSAEFPIANKLWIDYHETKGDPAIDRIFAAFTGDEAVSLARCRWHPDGYEVDAVFTPESHRGHGYADAAVRALVEACGHDTLYMHSVLNLTGFYGRYGFVAIEEKELPPTIMERFAWAQGAMEGANVCPMKRVPET